MLYDLLLAAFDKYFTYTTRTGTELSFLNYRIIQSEWGNSIDQTTPICQNILAKYFPDKTMKVPFQSSPFPLDNGVEMKIFEANYLSDKELSELAKIHRGGYSTWAGALLHIADKSRPGLSYVAMRLTGYNSNPRRPCFTILQQTMAYLYHHPHIPIMYSRKQEIEKPLTLFMNKGQAEVGSFF